MLITTTITTTTTTTEEAQRYLHVIPRACWWLCVPEVDQR